MNKINILNKKNKLLKILSDGCRIYPAYGDRRKATGLCKECVIVLQARLNLNDLEKS
ncbi:hypothetical protein N9T71_01105 [Alphaproteobacteria bacterium]|nr:hypothetical protein [Alphaproteobacteria bacterium]